MIGLLAIAALMISGAYAGSNDLNPAVACKLMVDGTRIRDMDSCETYYLCSGGVATKYSCGAGQQYNKDSQKCTSPNQSTCGIVPDDISQICKGKAKDVWVSDPYSCDGFYYCNGKGNGGQYGSCPPRTVFDENDQKCDNPSNLRCDKGTSDPNSDDAICSIVPNNVYFGNANRCNFWAVCNNGKYTTNDCGSGTKFNTVNGDCDYKSKCSQSSGPLSPVDPTSPDEPAASDGACTVAQKKTYKTDGTCVGFYWCSEQLVWRRGVCDNYQAFDPISKKCVARSKVYCNANTCANTKGSNFKWVNYPTDCKKYYTCDNNRQTYEGSCTSGSFNVDSQRCVPKLGTDYKACVAAGVDPKPPIGSGESGESGEGGEPPIGSGSGEEVEPPNQD